MQWYYTVQGQRQGPVDDAGLEQLARQGVIQDDTYVWREGLAEWQLYGTVKPKAGPVPTPQTNLVPPASMEPPTTDTGPAMELLPTSRPPATVTPWMLLMADCNTSTPLLTVVEPE